MALIPSLSSPITSPAVVICVVSLPLLSALIPFFLPCMLPADWITLIPFVSPSFTTTIPSLSSPTTESEVVIVVVP